MAKSKTLAEWLREQPKGALSRLMRDTGCAWSTVSRASRGERVGFAAAVRISRGTKGEVSEASLMHEDEDEHSRACA
jgi:hypothetical protein